MHRKNILPTSEIELRKVSRRKFVGGAVAAATAAIRLQPLLGTKESTAEASIVPYNENTRSAASFNYRISMARAERIDVRVQPDNGDAARFTDFSGNYSKALLHDALGVPNKAAFQSLLQALESGEPGDFDRILVGTPGGGANSKENCPQAALALDLEGLDSHATLIPAAPSVASAQTAAEQVEHYWAALLRDVPFTDYATNPIAAQAAVDLNKLSYVSGSGNHQIPHPVTPQNLFRGQFVASDGNVQGPY